MIDLGAPVRTVLGVTAFADHADARRFHYVPVRPRLVLDATGNPELRLFKYHLDPTLEGATGAALLQLTVDLAVSDDVLAQVRDTIAVAVGRSGIVLSPVWADSGTCRLILLDSGPVAGPPAAAAVNQAPADPGPPAAAPPASTLVESVLGGGDPDLAGNGTTMFACTLDPTGSAIVEQTLRGGGLPFGVVYDLQTSGLRPALQATIVAKFASAYHYYENRLHGGRLLAAADVGATIQDLVQQQALKITVDDLVPDADKDGVYQQALEQVQQYVLQTLFTPTLTEQPPATDTSTSIGSVVKGLLRLFTLTYSLQTVDDSELKTLSYSLAVAQAEPLTLSPQAQLSALLPPGAAADRLITAVPAAPPDQLTIDVASQVDLAAQGIDRVDVTLSYAGQATSVALLPTASRAKVPLWYRSDAGLEAGYTYSVELAADGPKGLTGRLTSPTATSSHNLIRVDPRELYQRVELRPSLQAVPPDRYPRVIVDVQADEAVDGWTVSDTVELYAGVPEGALAYRGRVDGLITLRYQARYITADGQPVSDGWHDTDPGVLVLGDPEPDRIVVQVLASARFGTAVARLVAELAPDGSPDSVTALSFDVATSGATWTYAPSADARGYRYRVTMQTAAGEVRTGDWLPGPPGTLVVGEGFSQLRPVAVRFVGTTLAAAGRLAAKVRLSFADPVAHLDADQEFLVQDPIAPITWSYPVADPAREDYTMMITWILADGSSHDEPPRIGSDLLQVVAVHP